MKPTAIFVWFAAVALTLPAPAADNCRTPDCAGARVGLYQQFDVFSEALSRIQAYYVHPTDSTDLIGDAIVGMANGLDPHSSYITPSGFKAMQDRTRGAASVGVTLTKRDGAAKVIAPIDGSPAAEAGIKSGDLIVEIDGTSLERLSLDEILDRLHGAAGSKVELTVLRAHVDRPLHFTLVRRAVHADAVTAHMIGDIGYIRIASLPEYAEHQLNDPMKTLKPNAKGYVLDLRDDPGGLLDEAMVIADAFLDAGVIADITGRAPSDLQHFTSVKGDITNGRPLVVLVNEGTASGAEIIAGALQDRLRAKLVGLPTFGTGTIQTIIPLSNGGALRLTTGEVVLPSGRNIQAIGLVPDVLAAQVPKNAEVYPLIAYTAARREAALAGHLAPSSPAPVIGTVLYPPDNATTTDFQLECALALLKGK